MQNATQCSKYCAANWNDAARERFTCAHPHTMLGFDVNGHPVGVGDLVFASDMIGVVDGFGQSYDDTVVTFRVRINSDRTVDSQRVTFHRHAHAERATIPTSQLRNGEVNR